MLHKSIVVFLTAMSIRIGLPSSKMHNGDDTPKESFRLFSGCKYLVNWGVFELWKWYSHNEIL